MDVFEISRFLSENSCELGEDLAKEYQNDINHSRQLERFKKILYISQLKSKMRVWLLDKTLMVNPESRLYFSQEEPIRIMLNIIIEKVLE